MAQTYKVSTSLGRSMSPCIEPGDNVYYSNEKNILSTIVTGDIIVFADAKKRLISHRVIKKEKNQYIVKGDNTYAFDLPVSTKSVLGKVLIVKKGHNYYDLTSSRSRIYNYYCLLYSLTLYNTHQLADKITKIIFRGKKKMLFFLRKTNTNQS